MDENAIRKYVRERYAGIARQGNSCCGPEASCGCGGESASNSRNNGYSSEEIGAVPPGADLGLGCGNPVELASLRKGEVVLDLGYGAGFDCFLAASAVGPEGKVIGVDMTPDMIEKARGNAEKGEYRNVEFRLGEIENLPAADQSVDAVLSNCVINLSPDKEKVFSEAYRILKPGGRVMISDIVLTRELPEAVAGSLAAYAGCVAGAIRKEEYLRLMEEAGFRDVRVMQESRSDIAEGEAAGSVMSMTTFGVKPSSKGSGECCAPQSGNASPCCGGGSPSKGDNRNDDSFVDGEVETPAGPVPRVHSRITVRDLLGRWKVRWGIGRNGYRVAPGLYALGAPDGNAPVLVTANYKLTFDVVRRELAGLDAWILVLDTRGINVWCAAGEGTFGTGEVVRRVTEARLAEVVSHRRLILPQLGAPGVAAHEVRRGCGFSVVYGTVRARDIRPFLEAGMKASPAMRRVAFPTMDRLVLTPVEITGMLRPAGWAAVVLFLLAGVGPEIFSLGAAWERGFAAVAALAAGILAGAVVTPTLLPWLPGRAFSVKGGLAGGVLAACAAMWQRGSLDAPAALALMLAMTAVSSFVALNFTGATPFTSPSGVEKEMRRALPVQAGLTVLAGLLWVGGPFLR